jgi:hypothetical protein
MCFLFFVPACLSAQTLDWKAGMYYFFDNTEFGKSTLTDDQTMTGVHLTPELGIKWENNHGIYAGVDLLKKSGTNDFIDDVKAVVYYRYADGKNTFYAGAFPRKALLKNYSAVFIQDSIRYFRPVMNGLFYQSDGDRAFFNVWLDWTGAQSETMRESFYLGTSGYKAFGTLFADFQAYLFHYANTRPSTPTFNVSEQFLLQLSLGVDLAGKTFFDRLDFSAGVLAGLERRRNTDNGTWIPVGAVLQLNATYKRFGVENLVYAGQKRLRLYKQYGGNFYWNTPFLQNEFYALSKWQIRLFNNKQVDAKIGMNLHFSEKTILFEQVLSLTVELSGRAIEQRKTFE